MKEQLNLLHEPSRDEDSLYAIADDIAAWLPEEVEGYQCVLASYIPTLPPLVSMVLLSALTDAEVKLTRTELLQVIKQSLYAQDKRLAQAAAACLILCGSTVGKALLQEALQNHATMPHARLVQGMFELLG